MQIQGLTNLSRQYDFHHMGMSQMCTGAGDYFRTSKPHSEKLWAAFAAKNLYRHHQVLSSPFRESWNIVYMSAV